MATTFPSTIQTFTDPLSTDALTGHAALHTTVNDTLEAIQNTVGVTGDSDPASHDYRIAQLESNIAPTGTVTMFAGASAPANWLLCNGAAISRTTYATLFGVVGTTYGAGNGSTTFNLPDFRDRVPVGAGSSYSLGQAIGALTDSITLSSANLPTHTHGLNNHTHTVNPAATSVTIGGSVRDIVYDAGAYTTGYISGRDSNNDAVIDGTTNTYGMALAKGAASVDIASTTSSGASGNTTDGGFANSAFSVDIVQPSRGINFIIKV